MVILRGGVARICNAASKYIHFQLPPNPVIANVMYLAGYIENWGRGLSMMNDECERVGLPAPKIIESGNLVKLIFARPQESDNTRVRISEDTRIRQVALQNDTVVQSRGIVTVQNGIATLENGTAAIQNGTVVGLKGKTKNSMIRLITLLGEEWYNAETLCHLLGFKSKSAFIRTYINKGMDLGIIRMENPDSPHAPNQRYGLTVKGKSIYYTRKD